MGVKWIGGQMLSDGDSPESIVNFMKENRDKSGFEFVDGQTIKDSGGRYSDFYGYASLRGRLDAGGNRIETVTAKHADGSSKTFVSCLNK